MTERSLPTENGVGHQDVDLRAKTRAIGYLASGNPWKRKRAIFYCQQR